MNDWARITSGRCRIDPEGADACSGAKTTRIIAAIEQQGVKIMAAIDDLKSAVTRLNTSTTTELRAVAAALTNQGDSADVEAAATSNQRSSGPVVDAETAIV